MHTTSEAWTAYPSGAPEFTPGLPTLLEHLHSLLDCLPIRSTWIHSWTAYPSGAPEFTPELPTPPEHLNSLLNCLPLLSTWIHSWTAYPSGVPEFTPELPTPREHLDLLLVFSRVRVVPSLVFCVVLLCRSLFVLNNVCHWIVSIFDLRLLVTPLVSTNFS